MPAINFSPDVSEECKKTFRERCRAFSKDLVGKAADADGSWKTIERFRTRNRELGNQPTVDQLKLLVSLHVVADLVAQGWTIDVTRGAAVPRQ